MIARVFCRHLLLVALCTMTCCAGNPTPGAPQGTVSSPARAALTPSESLPPLPDDREASTTRIGEVMGRNTFDRASNAIDDGNALRLLSGTREPAWGIWRFNPPLAEIFSIHVDIGGHAGDEYYIALSDYSRGTWEFYGPLSAGKTVEVNEARHRSAGGNLFLAVVAHSGSQLTVYRLFLTTEDGWVIVTVDDIYDMGSSTSLAVINAKPAIAYYDRHNNNLKYASSSTTTGSSVEDWSVITVDSDGETGAYPSLAEVAGQPAISYHGYTDQALKYARRDYLPLEVWTRVTVHASDIGEAVGYYTSLAVVNGYPLITYHDAIRQYLLHAQSTTPTGMSEADWATYITDDDYDAVGRFNSLAVVDGKAAVAYAWDYSACSLRYKWFSDPVKVGVYIADGHVQHTSLAVVDGKPAISYYDMTNAGLRYMWGF